MTSISTVAARWVKAPSATTWSRTVISLVFGGAVLLAIGSLLPWVTASAGAGIRMTRHGYDGDGVYTVIAAAVVALTLGVFSPRRATAGVLLALGVIATAISAANMLRASQQAEDMLARSTGVTTTVGLGLVLSAVAAVLIVAGSIVALRDTSTGQSPPPH
jgi:4-amino-4-deoxy-L-arabinose transferase-like glycosyltransferase